MEYKVIIFDWDGTLMDSIDKIIASMKSAAIDCKLPIPGSDDIRNIVGLRLDKAIDQLFPESNLEIQANMVKTFSHHYVNVNKDDTPFFPGVLPWLTSLKEQGYLLAIATGKSRVGLDRLLEKLKINDLFVVTYCSDETASKPNPLMLNLILKDLKLDAKEALMVGDSSYDLEMANNANIDCLGVSYGAHDNQTLNQFKPIAIVDDLPKEFALHVQ